MLDDIGFRFVRFYTRTEYIENEYFPKMSFNCTVGVIYANFGKKNETSTIKSQQLAFKSLFQSGKGYF